MWPTQWILAMLGLLLVSSSNGELALRMQGSIPYKRACVDLLCVRRPRIPRAVSLISLGFAHVYHGGIGQAAQVCSNGLAGVENSDVCCVAECGSCGGAGCRRRGPDLGLTADDCCVGLIRDANVFCGDSGAAPCIIGSGEGFGQSWLTATSFITRDGTNYSQSTTNYCTLNVVKLHINRSKTWNGSDFAQLHHHRAFGAANSSVTCIW